MKVFQRIKNIWKLGEIEIPIERKEQITNLISPQKMAEIIKRTTPVENFMNKKDE